MSIATTEINYLIWRYLQESGLEVSAYALDDETQIHNMDNNYSKYVPLGCLVDLIQKGILYTKMKSLIDTERTEPLKQDEFANMNFNFFTAMHEINEKEDTSKREILEHPVVSKPSQVETTSLKQEPQQEHTNSTPDDALFIKVIKESTTFDPSSSVSFSPTANNTIAFTQAKLGTHASTILNLSNNSQIQLPLSSQTLSTLLVAWSPKGDLLVSASENGEIHLWSTVDGSLHSVLAMHHWPIVSLKWSPQGTHLISLDIRNISIIWDISTSNPIKKAIVHLDKDSWLRIDRETGIFAAIQGKSTPLSTIIDSRKSFGTDTCWIDESKFITPGPAFSLIVSQVDEMGSYKTLGVLIGHEDAISCLQYSSSLRLLASASEDGVIRIFKGNSTNALQIITGHSLAVTFLCWINLDKDESSFLLSASLDGTVRVWDIFDNENLATACVNEGQPVLTASYSSTTQVLATGDASGAVCLWKVSAEAGKKGVHVRQSALYQHILTDEISTQGIVSDLSWSEDGTKLAVSYTQGESVVIEV